MELGKYNIHQAVASKDSFEKAFCTVRVVMKAASLSMLECSRKISSMEKENASGKTEVLLLAHTSMACVREKGNIPVPVEMF